MLKLKRILNSVSSDPPPSQDTSGVKLPKLEVPSFNGNLLHWQSFWEHFSISVHCHTSLSNSEKLMYLQQSLKGGSARNITEGLSHTGDNYEEAIQSLRT